MAFGGQMDDAVDAVRAYDAAHFFQVGNIGLDERIVGLPFYVLEVGEVAGIGQLIEVDNLIVRIAVDEQPHHV